MNFFTILAKKIAEKYMDMGIFRHNALAIQVHKCSLLYIKNKLLLSLLLLLLMLLPRIMFFADWDRLLACFFLSRDVVDFIFYPHQFLTTYRECLLLTLLWILLKLVIQKSEYSCLR